MRSRHPETLSKQTTVCLPETWPPITEAVARVQGMSVNPWIVEVLSNEIYRVREDEEFTSRARQLLECDRELLERLAR